MFLTINVCFRFGTVFLECNFIYFSSRYDKTLHLRKIKIGEAAH